MAAVDALSSATASAEAGKNSLAIDTQEFLEIMIAELTNQDPFEPMKNQDLLNQMSTIQQLQSNQTMNESFEDMIGQLSTFLDKQGLSQATAMIGQLISGTTTEGVPSYGRVTSVNLSEEGILLELDTGDKISLEDMTRIASEGKAAGSSNELIGQLVLALGVDGSQKVGNVVSTQVSNGTTTIVFDTGERLDVISAIPLTAENAGQLIGSYVSGGEGDSAATGIVSSVEFTAEETMLTLGGGERLALSDVKEVIAGNE